MLRGTLDSPRKIGYSTGRPNICFLEVVTCWKEIQI